MNKRKIDFTQLQKLCKCQPNDILLGKQYLYKNNNAKILAVCHMDTVFDHAHKYNFCHIDENYIFSPKLDDRLGVYTILHYLPKYHPNVKYDYLITTDEEIGKSTAQLFAKVNKKKYNWIVEFDRKGEDVVLYDYKHNKA